MQHLGPSSSRTELDSDDYRSGNPYSVPSTARSAAQARDLPTARMLKDDQIPAIEHHNITREEQTGLVKSLRDINHVAEQIQMLEAGLIDLLRVSQDQLSKLHMGLMQQFYVPQLHNIGDSETNGGISETIDNRNPSNLIPKPLLETSTSTSEITSTAVQHGTNMDSRQPNGPHLPLCHFTRPFERGSDIMSRSSSRFSHDRLPGTLSSGPNLVTSVESSLKWKRENFEDLRVSSCKSCPCNHGELLFNSSHELQDLDLRDQSHSCNVRGTQRIEFTSDTRDNAQKLPASDGSQSIDRFVYCHGSDRFTSTDHATDNFSDVDSIQEPSINKRVKLTDEEMLAHLIEKRYRRIAKSSIPAAGESTIEDTYAHTRRPRRKPVRDARGVLLRKDGKPDKRAHTSAKNLLKVDARKGEREHRGKSEPPIHVSGSRSATRAPSPSDVMLQNATVYGSYSANPRQGQNTGHTESCPISHEAIASTEGCTKS